MVEANFYQLLQGIVVLSKANSRKAFSRSGNYQDNAVVPLDCKHDDKAVQLQDEEGDNDIANANDDSSTFLSTISKVTLYHMCDYHIVLRPCPLAPEDHLECSVQPPTLPNVVQRNLRSHESRYWEWHRSDSESCDYAHAHS
jgi:hypothetical protein